MSTILKALKKVEGKREAVAAKTEIPRALKSPIIEESRGWLKRIVAIALLLMVVVGVAAGYRFWQSENEMQVVQRHANEIETVESVSKSPLAENDLSPKEPVASKKTAPLTQMTEMTIQPPPVVADLPLEQLEVQQKSRSTRKNQPSRKHFNTRQNRVALESQISSKSSVQPKPLPPTISPVENTPKMGVPLLEDRSLDIQALVYSEDSTKRMIVLNGEILRQGQDYKGYTIEAIESQRVLVKKNGKVSALLFGK